jgi:hypothetical protein
MDIVSKSPGAKPMPTLITKPIPKSIAFNFRDLIAFHKKSSQNNELDSVLLFCMLLKKLVEHGNKVVMYYNGLVILEKASEITAVKDFLQNVLKLSTELVNKINIVIVPNRDDLYEIIGLSKAKQEIIMPYNSGDSRNEYLIKISGVPCIPFFSRFLNKTSFAKNLQKLANLFNITFPFPATSNSSEEGYGRPRFRTSTPPTSNPSEHMSMAPTPHIATPTVVSSKSEYVSLSPPADVPKRDNPPTTPTETSPLITHTLFGTAPNKPIEKKTDGEKDSSCCSCGGKHNCVII